MSREKSACEKINVILCCLKILFALVFGETKCLSEICWISYLAWSESDSPPGFCEKRRDNPSFKEGNGRDCMVWGVWKVSWNKQATVHLPHRDKKKLAVANKRNKVPVTFYRRLLKTTIFCRGCLQPSTIIFWSFQFNFLSTSLRFPIKKGRRIVGFFLSLCAVLYCSLRCVVEEALSFDCETKMSKNAVTLC